MRQQTLDPDYTFDITRRVWIRSDYPGIGYSDGDEVEQRIAGILNNARDLTVLSAELASHCTDWPSLYHLSRRRANLLRPLEDHLQNASLLEVGAGCGAISRYLGEIGAEVLALEGSPYRASIAASRCRDLDNVTVVAEAFHLFNPVPRFDVVTLIGVLEYARKFFPSSDGDPVDEMLARAKNFLKPGGKLIIAIENQLGLKYFAGFPEDHIGKPMFGIEEHYSAGGVVTFGRRELDERVAKAGLAAQQWWYPFPDYKLPTLLVSEAGAVPGESVDLTSVVRSACIADPQYPRSISFSQERAWRPVVYNGLLRDMANSFLLLASDSDFSQQQELPLAVHYATERRPEFAKKVVFERAYPDPKILTHQVALYPSVKAGVGSLLKQQLANQPFIKGTLWHDRLLQILTSPGWTLEQIQEWMKTWFDAFCTLAGITDPTSIADETVSGRYFDAIPRNMVIDEAGRAVFIDQEWICREDLNVWYLSFRALLASLSPIRSVAQPLEHTNLKVSYLFACIMQHLNIEVTEQRVKKYFELEISVDYCAGGMQSYNSKELVLWFPSYELRVFDTQTPVHEKLAQREEQLETTSKALAERDEQLTAVIQALSHHKEQLAMVKQTLTERDEQLEHVLESSSWRITQPLRTFKKWLKSVQLTG